METPANTVEPNPPKAKKPLQDLEIKDAQLIFNTVWAELENEFGLEQLSFPKEMFWLNGAPGAGKGTHTRFIIKHRDYTEEPVVISELLESPEAVKRKDAGLMVGDREVTELLLRRLLDKRYANGAVIDGYPRTKVQVECLKLFYNKLSDLRARYLDTPLEERFRKPQFHILVLFIDEAESIRRQLERGKQAIARNHEVEESGMGTKVEIRKTDLDEDAARNRYRTFKELTYESLQSLREVFYYHYINAHGSVSQVQERILEELKYQSSLELDQNTYDRLAAVPVASSISQHARQDLVNRLDGYEKNHTDLFERVVMLITEKFIPIIQRHAISGIAQVNTEDPVFEDPLALAMLIDTFSERGFHAMIDVHREEIPDRIDPQTFRIFTRTKKVYRVQIHFPRSDIRRGS
jgi:adenylate kinase